MTDWFWQF